MDLGQAVPLVLYDDRCYVCARFARAVGALGRGGLATVGHYSETGEGLRGMLGPDALEMFWFVDGRTAFGGRAALLPLLREVVRAALSRRTGGKSKKMPEPDVPCATRCRGAGAVFLRSASLLSNSRTVRIDGDDGAGRRQI